jgi:hypothetical protein
VIFNAGKQCEALDLGLARILPISRVVLPSVYPDFELDGSANLGSAFLQGMLAKGELTGFPNNYELSAQPSTVGDADNEAPTEGDCDMTVPIFG